MKPIVRDFIVGLTVIAGITVLVVLMMFFNMLTLESSYTFNVRVSNASGLAQASRVTMNGVSIGQVKEATILPPDIGGVELLVKIKSTAKIPKKSVVAIDKGLIGDASLDFVVPRDLASADIADHVQEGYIFEGGSPGSLVDKLTSALDKPMARFTKTAEKIEQMADVYTEVGNRVNDALEPRTMAQVQAGQAPNLRSLIHRLDTTLLNANTVIGDQAVQDQIKGIVAKADSVMTDAKDLVTSAKGTMQKVDTAVTSADTAIKDIGKAVGDAGKRVDDVAASATAALKQVEDAAANMNVALETATKGNGTLGQLMSNPDLYNNLRDAASRMDKALAEYQLLAEKLKAEGIRLRL
jgi:phospholipid/cholesterol/gamma-HCH transport system substrate-binding protein